MSQEHPHPWRLGRKVPRNIYDANDQPILMAPDEETAALIVEGVNERARHSACIVCGCDLILSSEAPHCFDCVPTDEQREAWESGGPVGEAEAPATPPVEPHRPCDCPVPGLHKGPACRVQRFGLPFTSDDWCDCPCHAIAPPVEPGVVPLCPTCGKDADDVRGAPACTDQFHLAPFDEEDARLAGEPGSPADRRACAICRALLFECMGCVLARDVCRALDGEILWSRVREICARCAERHPNPETLTAALDAASVASPTEPQEVEPTGEPQPVAKIDKLHMDVTEAFDRSMSVNRSRS